jgi:glyoxylase-like metal-dependent hydrolase (beta-lactamase superfamily II)
MRAFICITCGSEFAESEHEPERCPICEDERQYVGLQGQKWTTLEELRSAHRNRFRDEEPGLLSIVTNPRFGIGQRAFLVRTPGGNILWDCVSLIDAETVEAVADAGGLRAIAISHPHYYASMVEWSRAFRDAPIYLHAWDQQWVMRPDPHIAFWDGEQKPLWDDIRLICCGGHSQGGTVLHWPKGAAGRGALLSGDIIQVVPDRGWVSFMYSYPNLIPLHAAAIRRIVNAVEPFAFERVYGAFSDMTVQTDGKAAIRRSAERYVQAIS